jgi:mannose-6-phosphate isomerase-like protein (cupin superfamily)
MFLFAGQTCPNHHHKIKLETFFIVKGKVRMEYKGKEMILNPGDVLLIELGGYHRFSGLENSLILEVSMPSLPGDSHFSNTAIPTGDNYRP